MFVKIHPPLASTGGNNKGSSSGLFDYLDKEEKEKSILEKIGFFSHTDSHLTKGAAQEMIDNNRKNLGKDDYKFYMVTINPSQKEQEFLAAGKTVDQMNDKELKSFEDKLARCTRSVMNEYAKSFDKNVTGNDLVYAAKIEHHRTHGGRDKEVLSGVKKSGERKEGLQSHVHVVVSRNNKEQDMKLSPLSKQRPNSKSELNNEKVKQGFEHVGFKLRSEQAFDKEFNFTREQPDKITLTDELTIRKDKTLSALGLTNAGRGKDTSKELSPGQEPFSISSMKNELVNAQQNATGIKNILEEHVTGKPAASKFSEQANKVKDRHLDPINTMKNQLENDLLKGLEL